MTMTTNEIFNYFELYLTKIQEVKYKKKLEICYLLDFLDSNFPAYAQLRNTT